MLRQGAQHSESRCAAGDARIKATCQCGLLVKYLLVRTFNGCESYLLTDHAPFLSVDAVLQGSLVRYHGEQITALSQQQIHLHTQNCRSRRSFKNKSTWIHRTGLDFRTSGEQVTASVSPFGLVFSTSPIVLFVSRPELSTSRCTYRLSPQFIHIGLIIPHEVMPHSTIPERP